MASNLPNVPSQPSGPLPPPPPPPSNMNQSAPMPDVGQPQGPIASRGTLVDVKMSCRDLKSPDGLHTEPSSFVVVFCHIPGKSDWTEVMRSETIKSSSNPEYRQMFQLEYKFELYQQLRIVAFERNAQTENLQAHTLIGVADCTLGQIVSSESLHLPLPLINQEASNSLSINNSSDNNFGTVYLRADEIKSAKNIVSMSFSISKVIPVEVVSEQEEYLNSLRAKVSTMPQGNKGLDRRGASRFVRKFIGSKQDNDQNNNNMQNNHAVPAHLANQNQQQKDQLVEVQNEINQVQLNIQNRPPPFVPFVIIQKAAKSASSAVDIHSPNIEWEDVYKSIEIQDYQELETGTQLLPLTLSEYDICEGDENRLIKLAVVRKANDPNEPSQYIGEYRTTFPALRATCLNQKQIQIQLNPMGFLTINDYSEKIESSFIDYLRGGWCDFGLMTAIDFTSSNGDPTNPNSKHYLATSAPSFNQYTQQHQQAKPNEYEAAIRTVANMLSSYSSDTKIPTYGFGAIIERNKPVSHCFPVRGSDSSHFNDGVNGLIDAYKHTLRTIKLHGPTMFSEILRTTNSIVTRRHQLAIRAGNTKLAYTVLLILTDGAISDYDLTLQELIKLSFLPISVVIIGIGTEDFGKMKSFDISNGTLSRGRTYAARPFVQFVPYNDFKGDLALLAEKVLGNIPEQVISYRRDVQHAQAPSQNLY